MIHFVSWLIIATINLQSWSVTVFQQKSGLRVKCVFHKKKPTGKLKLRQKSILLSKNMSLVFGLLLLSRTCQLYGSLWHFDPLAHLISATGHDPTLTYCLCNSFWRNAYFILQFDVYKISVVISVCQEHFNGESHKQ